MSSRWLHLICCVSEMYVEETYICIPYIFSSLFAFSFDSVRVSRVEAPLAGRNGWRKRAIPRSRFRRARRAGHSSILASRADGLSLPLPLWPSFSSSSSSASPSLAKSLYSVSLFLLPFACSFRQLLSLLLPSPLFSTQLPASTQTPPTDTASPPLASPLAGRIIKVPEGDQARRRTRMKKKRRKELEGWRHERWRGSISGRGCYGANNRRLKRKNKGLAVHHRDF